VLLHAVCPATHVYSDVVRERLGNKTIHRDMEDDGSEMTERRKNINIKKQHARGNGLHG
jgi:hypothetical protein